MTLDIGRSCGLESEMVSVIDGLNERMVSFFFPHLSGFAGNKLRLMCAD